MSDSINMFAEAATRLFEDKCTKAAHEAAEAGGVQPALWSALVDGGFTAMLVPERQGGAGASMIDVMETLRVAGRYSLPAPIAETIIAAWVLALAGLPPVQGPLTLALGTNAAPWRFSGSTGQWKVSGKEADVPWGATASVVIVAQDGAEAVVGMAEPGRLSAEPRSNIGSEPRDGLKARGRALDGVTRTTSVSRDQVFRYMAMARAVQIVGALGRALDLSVRYVGERKQFGRPLSKFQAVQQQLAVLAGEVASSSAITDAAAANIDSADADLLLAACRARLADAIDKVGIAHQVHGAIGFTREYPLQLATRRLWGWRDEYGSAVQWRERLGRQFVGTPADDLWVRLAAVGMAGAQ